MLALVMSGAANYGAMQAGALEAIFATGFKADMLVGTSAGALNAINLAMNPSLQGTRELQRLWAAAGPKQVGIPTPIGAVRRLVTGQDSLVPNNALVSFLESNLPQELETFEDLEALSGIPTFVAAVCMDTGEMRVFGDRKDDRLLDGAMASTAVPPYFPPWVVGESRYLDGGVYSKLPIRVAIERGATQVLALDVSHAMGSKETAKGILGLSAYAVSLMVEAQAAQEVAWARSAGVAVRVFRLPAPVDVAFWDYTQAERLLRMGYELAEQQLAEQPLRFAHPVLNRLRSRLASLFLKSARESPFQ